MGGIALILVDTHVALWLDLDSFRIGPRAKDIAVHAWKLGQLAISAISFWEIAMLQQNGKIELSETTPEWRRIMLSNGFREVALNGAIAVSAATLPDMHRDPADRFLVATAMHIDAALLTADRKLLAWSGPLKRLDARR